MEPYKKFVKPNWKWSIFHHEVATPLFKKVAFASAAVFITAMCFLMWRDKVSLDFSKKHNSEPVSMVNHSGDVLKFFNTPISPVTLTAAEFAEKYYADDNLQKLEESIVTDLNSSGKVSVDHVEIKPSEYAQNAQNPAFIQTNISPDLLVFSAIIFSPQSNQINRFIAIARKLDKWRLIVINSPVASNNLQNLSSFPDTSEKIYKAVNG